jgi:hypothetical protein
MWLTIFDSLIVTSNVHIEDGWSVVGLLGISSFMWFLHQIPDQSLATVAVAYSLCYLLMPFAEHKQTLFDRITGRLVIIDAAPR